jgi:hypothetical protein
MGDKREWMRRVDNRISLTIFGVEENNEIGA